MNFSILENVSRNEGQHTGLFVVQHPTYRTPSQTIQEGLDFLRSTDDVQAETIIPIITDEVSMGRDQQFVAKAHQLGIGSIATFGTQPDAKGNPLRNRHGAHFGKVETHFGPFTREHGLDNPNFLASLLKLPKEVHGSRLDLYGRMPRLHLKVGTMTVQGSECSLELLEERQL